MSAQLELIPNDAALVDQEGTITRRWYIWLSNFWLHVKTLVGVIGSVYSKTSQTATITAATIASITQTGVYRASYYLRVTTIPTTSFSLTLTIGWREGGVTKSQAFTALTGAPGTLATAFQNGSVVIRADSGTLVTITIAYVSVGATAMVFGVDAPVELLN
jgi:hypothetical protein